MVFDILKTKRLKVSV